ncbi:MAG: hypothetical protein COB37_05035 [Kordiimonadales bacterium]|nr:MAG: hypothetical protein COB37_05035 [Kordiimonadales bacterium]
MPDLSVKTILRGGILAAFVATVFTVSMPSSAAPDDVRKWYTKIAKKIAKKHVYPRSAISREIEGKAKVMLIVSRDGEITSFEIQQSSGAAILDKAIPKMIKRLNPLPKPPEGVPDSKLTLVVPITWRLN